MSRIITPPHIRKFGKDIEPSSPVVARNNLYGEYRIIKRNSMGQMNYDTGWRPNLITDRGIRYAYAVNQITYWHIGTGTTPPATTDTSIETLLQWCTSTAPSNSIYANSGPPNYVRTHIAGKRSNGGVSGNVSEFTIGSNSGGTGAGIRCAISPAIPLDTDEVLDIYHKIYEWPINVALDHYQELTLNGDDYGITSRHIRVETANAGLHTLMGPYTSNAVTIAYYTQTLPAIAYEDPSTSGGTDYIGYNAVQSDHSGTTWPGPGSIGFVEWYRIWGLDKANFGTLPTGGIGLIKERLHNSPDHCLASRFARLSDGARLQKDNTMKFTQWWREEWSRYDTSNPGFDAGFFALTGVDIDTSVA